MPDSLSIFKYRSSCFSAFRGVVNTGAEGICFYLGRDQCSLSGEASQTILLFSKRLIFFVGCQGDGE